MAGMLRSLRLLRSLKYPFRNTCAFISTSDKNKDTAAYPPELVKKKPPPPPVTVEDFAETKPRVEWVSYGYDYENFEEDRSTARIVNFFMITVFLVGGTFVVAYIPDFGNRDWATREAYLRLHEREKLGLPLIDKNYIDPEKVVLPSDEELGDTEIIL